MKKEQLNNGKKVITNSYRNGIKDYLQLIATFLIYSFAGIFSKISANQESLFKMLLFASLELLMLGVYAIVWQQLLKKFQLTTAMAFKGVTVIFAIVWSVILFGETVNWKNIIGAILIVIGIGVVASDD